MDQKHLVKVSKRLARVLRHDPGRVGLVLDSAGWVPVDALLTAMHLSRAEFDTVVASNDKRRFAIETGSDGVTRVRASQGHTIPVDLQLAALTPPERLYHGTSSRVISSIYTTGINRGSRHHVHLSEDTVTARRVGSRRAGAVTILLVDAGAMARDGHLFYRSANGVWLTDHVPVAYLLGSADNDGMG